MMRTIKIAVAQTLLVLALHGGAHAQMAVYGTIAVQVTDASGGVVPGAAVVLVNKDRGLEFRKETDKDGSLLYAYLLPGLYQLKVAAPGFASHGIDEIRLLAARNLRIPVVLQVGAPGAMVSVTAAFSGIDTTSPTVRQMLPQAAIKEMPVITGTQGRSLLAQMQLLFPGASSFRYTGMGDAWGMSLSINGSLVGGVGFHVDGVDNNYMFGSTGGAATVGPNPDAVEELSLLAQNYSAESGGHASQVKWSTRSGTNVLHGQLRALAVNPYLRARDFFEADTGAGYRTSMGGFQLSGPVMLPSIYNGRNRTFWFYDTEWTRSSWPYAENYTFPSDALRNGDFSGLPQNLWPVDPTTHQPFPDGRIPAGRILEQSRFLLDRFVPRNPGGGQVTLTNHYQPSGYQFTTHVDHRLGNSDSLSGSLFYNRNPSTYSSNATLGNSSRSLERGYNLSLQYIRNITPQVINSFTFGQTRWTYDSKTIPAIAADLEREGYNIHNTSSLSPGYPNLRFDTSAPSVSPAGAGYVQKLSTLQWKDDLSLIRRSHQWKFGTDVRWGTADWCETYYPPTFSFSRFNPAGTGNDFADFLLGIPNSYSQGSDSVSQPGRFMAALYAQDAVKLRNNLTLDLGLRYEWNGALLNRNGWNGAFRPGYQSKTYPNAPAGALFNGDWDPVTERFLDSGITPPNNTNLAPRFGIAWSPGFDRKSPAGRVFGGAGRSSIRAGYGLYYIVGLANPIFGVQYMQPWTLIAQLDRSMLTASGGNMLNPWGTDVDPFAGGLAQRPFYPPLNYLPLIDLDLRDAYQHQWTLSVQRQLPLELVLDVAYVGNRGLHLLRKFEGNPGKLIPGANQNNVESRRTYSGYGSVMGFASDGKSLYNSLQLTVSRRFRQGLLFNAHYVWSKALDNASGIGVFQPADRAVTPWARSDADRRHSFAGYWLMNLPGWDRYAPLRCVISGWRLSGSVQIRSGIPLQILNPFDSTLHGYAQTTPDITGAFVRLDPRVVRTFKLPNGQTVTGNFFFDPTVFKVVRPATPEQARPGNLGRNAFTGLGAVNMDLSITKEFRVRERHRIETRIDATNALNHAQFYAQGPSANANNAMFGRVAGTNGGRKLQFQVRYSF